MEIGIDIDVPINEDLINVVVNFAMPNLCPYVSSCEDRLKYRVDYGFDWMYCNFYIGELYVRAEEEEKIIDGELTYVWSKIEVFKLEKSADGITTFEELDDIDGEEIDLCESDTLRSLAFPPRAKSARTYSGLAIMQ